MSFYFNIADVETLSKLLFLCVSIILITLTLINTNGDLGKASVFRSIQPTFFIAF